MNKGVFFALVYFTGLLGTAVLMFMLLWPFLSAIAWAGVIALAAYPLHRWFLRRFRGRENLAAAFTTTTVFLIVVVPLAVLLVVFAGEATQVVINLQDYAAQGHIPGKEELLSNPKIQEMLKELEPYIGKVDLMPLLVGAMKSASGLLVGASTTVLLTVFAGILKFLIMVAVLFFAFRDGDRITKAFWEIVPLKESDKAILESAVKRVVNAVLYGVVLTCVIQGTLGGVGFAFVGLPSPVFFGAVMMVTAFIPVVGTALVWVPGALYLAATGSYGKALILTVWSIAVVSSIDNFVRPYFISTKSNIPLLVILLGVLGGIATMGFLGVIVGPLLFAVFLELFRVYREDIFPHLKKTMQEPKDSPPADL